MRRLLVPVLAILATVTVVAEQNRVDTVTPSAPELASYGTYDIGVRTIQITDKNRPDILNTKEGGPTTRYDRTLTLEVWYDDQKAFGSTLYNRPFDQLFVLNEIDRLGKPGSGSFLAGLADASRSGIVGYSMGGYGVVNVIGGGYSKASETGSTAPPNRMLAERSAANPEYQKSMDPRIKAAIAIGPWGMQGGFWDAEGLKGIRTPVLFVAGSVDNVSGYEKGTRAIFQGAVNADRYLLTFVNANHNAGAPIPAPRETYTTSGLTQSSPFSHYADAVWDTARMNNILDHFASAYFAVYLKGEQDKQAYLDVVPNGKDAVYAIDRDGKPTATHTHWKGFKRGTAVGLVLERLAPAK